MEFQQGNSLSPRNKLYLKISDKLNEDQVKSLRDLLVHDNYIDKGKFQKKTPHEIFNMLEADGKIGEGNLGLLKDLLTALKETRLAKEAEELEQEESMQMPSTSKRKSPEDASSAKQPKMSSDDGSSDNSDCSDSGTGCSSLDSSHMEADEFESAEDLTTSRSAELTAFGTFETVGDVRKRINHLRTKIAKLTRYPNNISETKTEDVSKACQELDYLVNLLNEQSRGELKMDITPLNTETQNEFQEMCEAGTLQQEIEKKVKGIMSTNDDIVNVRPGVEVEFNSSTGENTNCSQGRCAQIKVTAANVELADSCKLDKDSAVRQLFRYLVENSQNLRPVIKYLNSFYVQVREISYGSIDFECLCLTPESAVRLQDEYDGKNLQAQVQRVISSLAILTEFGIKSISLSVHLKFADEGPVSSAASSRLRDECSADYDNPKETCGPGNNPTSIIEDTGTGTVATGVTRGSGSRRLFGRADKQEATESLQSQLAQMEVDSQQKWEFGLKSNQPLPDKRPRAGISGLHSKLGFNIEELKPKSGGKTVQSSSIPLILPNDLKYNAATGAVEKISGVRREILQVVPEASGLLEGIEEPVSVLSICGPCRSGKSYILSRLLGTTDAFELGHRMDPQTFGIWMGTKVLRGKDFTIVLLDTEGIDAAGASAEASILVLTILLSSQLIYNSMNVLYKGDLEKMQCFIKLAKGITIKKGKKTQMSAFREFFPDFLWLLRDVSLMITDRDGNDMDPTEYLKTRVLGRWGEDEFDESTSDKVGRAILTFFPSVECATLERPSEKKEVMNNIAQHTDSLNPEFNKGVSELTERLLLKSRAKSGYDKGSTVSGEALSIMVKQYVEAVNDPNAIPALDNTWQNTIELMRARAIEEVVKEYNQQMQVQLAIATNNGQDPLEESPENPNPMTWEHWRRSAARSRASGRGRLTTRYPSQPTIMDIHNELLSKVTDMLLAKIGHFGIGSEERSDENRHLIDQMQKRLVEREERTVDYVAEDNTNRKQKGFVVTGGELFRYIQQNKEHSKIFCQQLFEHLFDPIREHVESPPAGYDFQKLVEELDNALQQYHEQARGPEKWTVLQEMTSNIEKLKANFEKIKGYHRTIMEEQQKTYEAQLNATKLAGERAQLRKQAQDMQETQQESLQKREQLYKEKIKKMKREMEEQHAVAIQKIQDYQAAMLEQQARNERERSEREASDFMEIINRLEEQLKDIRRQLGELKNQPPPPPPPPRPPPREKGACTIM